MEVIVAAASLVAWVIFCMVLGVLAVLEWWREPEASNKANQATPSGIIPVSRTAGPRVDLHLPEELLARIEAWRRSQPGQPSRTKTLHHLINRGLEAVANDPAYAPITPPDRA